MGFSLSSFDPTSSKNAFSDIGEVALSVSTLGQSDILLGEGAIAQEKRHLEGKAEEEARAKLSVREKQEQLREIDLERAIGSQVEAEQLAQREIFRDQQRQAQALQQSQASIQNVAGQSAFGVGGSSALAGLSAAAGTQVAQTQGGLAADSDRLATGLESNLDFLQTTFDLGGDINQLNQQIADLQAKSAQRAATISGVASGLGAIATGNPAGVAAGTLQIIGATTA